MNSQSENQNPDAGASANGGSCESLEAQVESLNTSAAAGEFDKTAKAKLTELAKGTDAALQKYKDPANGRGALVERWRKQHERVEKIRAQLEQCYPDWKDKLRDCVCKPVIAPLADIRESLKCKLGKCQIELDDATFCFKEAESQLEAWKDITGWLKKRLDTNDALIDEICKLDKCEDHAFALYIFFFELLRQHSRLMPGETEKEDRYDPVLWFCCVKLEPDCDLTGYPWLIDPDRYKDKLGEVACAWRKAGTAKAEAEACLAWIEELRKQLEEGVKPENRRHKAKQHLRECKPGKGNGGPPDKKPGDDPEADPCPDPGSGSTPEPDPDPEPDPCPDPEPDCPEEPDPKPDPCDDPDPEPDPKPGTDSDPTQQQSS